MRGSVFFYKQKTAYDVRISDWSSDVCSSDLRIGERAGTKVHHRAGQENAALGVGEAVIARAQIDRADDETGVGNAVVAPLGIDHHAVQIIQGRKRACVANHVVRAAEERQGMNALAARKSVV